MKIPPFVELGKKKPVAAAQDVRTQIVQALEFFFRPGDTFEVCLMEPKIRKHGLWGSSFIGGQKGIAAGWFDNIAAAADCIVKADCEVEPAGIYCTLNPVQPALLGRASNRLKANVARTKDDEIVVVRHLLIDADPKRPSGISSTNEEKAAALALLQQIRADLRNSGWDEPLLADSGNGWHLIYRLDLDCGLMLPDLLKSLDHKYSNDQVTIDTAVGNPARLTKMYGTMTRKGDSTNDRPHRRSRIVELPEEVQNERSS